MGKPSIEEIYNEWRKEQRDEDQAPRCAPAVEINIEQFVVFGSEPDELAFESLLKQVNEHVKRELNAAPPDSSFRKPSGATPYIRGLRRQSRKPRLALIAWLRRIATGCNSAFFGLFLIFNPVNSPLIPANPTYRDLCVAPQC